MHRREPAHYCVIFHRHMPRERRHVRHDDVITKRHIVRHVTIRQDVIVRADLRYLAVARLRQ